MAALIGTCSLSPKMSVNNSSFFLRTQIMLWKSLLLWDCTLLAAG